MTDRPSTVIVLAKEPRPGRVKTRLQTSFSPAEAADLAAAALADTLAAVRASGARRRVLAWEGDPSRWRAGFEVVRQPDGGLADRLAAAFSGPAATGGSDGPTLLIGMDTPQVDPGLLDTDWQGADAVLGLSEDGGFWAIGLRGIDPGPVFAGIPMSTERTGAAQLARLADLNLRVRLLPPLRDVDEPSDADAIADRYPSLRFSRRHAELIARRVPRSVDRLFDDLYGGRRVSSRRIDRADDQPDRRVAGESFVDGLDRWVGSADAADRLVVSRCEPPVIDIGCGPGRMVAALQADGRAALGIDISRTAVSLGARDGALVLRRRVDDLLPAEGRWGTALLLDGNIGIGGDVARLLARCAQLVGPGGLIICEVDPLPDRHERFQLVLSGPAGESEPTPWAVVGAAEVARAAATVDLVVAEEWRAADRSFVALRSVA